MDKKKSAWDDLESLGGDEAGRVFADAMKSIKDSHILRYEDRGQRAKFGRLVELVKELFEDDDDAVIEVSEDDDTLGACAVYVRTTGIDWDDRLGDIQKLMEIFELCHGVSIEPHDHEHIDIGFAVPNVVRFKDRKSGDSQ